ncbi:hypothetical protein E8E13_007496 [Curvularia kusanoi]|uniref:Uncharacterized protein n=1 Tax=Curvularia kusanoi TaxID=90978 RepID=A0A9P4W9R2_CURKU|nr:hypothetical protein E8E13_007496 [Curvularia kusanoi]
MRSTTLGSTLFLLAGVAIAQQSDSIVTEIPSSLIQTTEGVFTIQTSVPVGSVTPVPLPSPSFVSDGDVTLTLPVESLPPVESNPGSTPSHSGILTHPLLPPISQTTDPLMSIPQGETPESTGPVATSSHSGSTSASASRSAPAQQTTAAAPPSLHGDGTPFMFALGLSGVSMLFGAVWALL